MLRPIAVPAACAEQLGPSMHHASVLSLCGWAGRTQLAWCTVLHAQVQQWPDPARHRRLPGPICPLTPSAASAGTVSKRHLSPAGMQDADQQLIQAARLKHERELGEAALQESRDEDAEAGDLDDPAKFENLEEDAALTALVAKPADEAADGDQAPNPVAKTKVLAPVTHCPLQ